MRQTKRKTGAVKPPFIVGLSRMFKAQPAKAYRTVFALILPHNDGLC